MEDLGLQFALGRMLIEQGVSRANRTERFDRWLLPHIPKGAANYLTSR